MYIKTFLRIIAFLAVSVFLTTGCGEKPTEKTVKGTVTANEAGEVEFKYSRNNTDYPPSCTFTTDLPEPDNQFVLTVSAGVTTDTRKIEGLMPGQQVKWEAKVEGNPLNHGSDDYVYIINN